jgi:Flp pilus assembly protein CpaB
MAIPVRNRNPTYLTVAGVVVAVLGALLVIVLLASPGRLGVTVPANQSNVVVASHDLAPRTAITAADLTVVQYPTEQLPANSFSAIEKVKGQFVAFAISKNTPITSSMIVSAVASVPTTGSQPVLDIPQGQVAVAIPSGDALANVAGYIHSGDHVDIMVRGLPGQKSGQVNATFTNLTIVLAAGPPAAAGVGTASVAPAGGTWVIFVPVVRAEEVIYLFNAGSYTFVLRSRADDSATEGPIPPVGRDEFNAAYNIR